MLPMMETRALVLLVFLLPLILAMDKDLMEKIRLLYDHQGIETATVHISYPHSPSLRRLTKREALDNLLPRRHDNLTVKVTLTSSRRMLDFHLRPSELSVHGALVKVMNADVEEEAFMLRDEGCHYQGLFDEGRGMASVHFCDGVLVGAAQNEHTEYCFHSHQSRRSGGETGDKRSGRTPESGEKQGRDNDSLGSVGDEELYHTIVSWKNVSGDLEHDEEHGTTLSHNYVEIDSGKEQGNGRKKRQTGSSDDEGGEVDEDDDEGDQEDEDVTAEEPPGVPDEGGIGETKSTEYDPNKVPVAEFGIIVDEDFLRDHQFLYPTRTDILHMLMIKYTAVQALYGNPDMTGFNLKIQIKLVYLWKKNPSYYKGSQLTIGQRMGAGRMFSDLNADYKSTDVAALFTSQAPGNVVGMAFLNGACRRAYKTYVTRKEHLNWNTEAHELGHTLGLGHVPGPCVNAIPPYDRGFMNAVRSMFLPCYAEFLNTRLKTKALSCLFKQNVNTTNIPRYIFKTEFPVQVYGLDFHCRTAFRNDAIYLLEEDRLCGAVLCAVTDEADAEFGMSMVIKNLVGRICGPKSDGKICIQKACKLPVGNTTIPVMDTVTGTGFWSSWYRFASSCSSACGVGVRISYRNCSRVRPMACPGPKYTARLCNSQPCAGDELMTELELRADRSNYACSLLKARRGPLSKYLQPKAKPPIKRVLTDPISIASCLVTCLTVTREKGAPLLQRAGFGTTLQTDGTLCGPVTIFELNVLGVTWRCVRGRCVKFGCDGFSMETGGKVKDKCGECGGANDGCYNGQTTVRVGNEMATIAELTAGTRNIMFAVQPDSEDEKQLRYMKLALVDKEDSTVIVPGERGRFKIVTNDQNPLRFAGAHWTTLANNILSSPGPLDQPMRIKVKNMDRSPAEEVVVIWGYTRPKVVPPPPTPCQNNGVPNSTTGGCQCSGNTHGRQCEFPCHDLCFNGGKMLPPKCKCDCSNNKRTSPITRCGCLERFAGPDCKGCSIPHCYNGGSLIADTCKCRCREGCGGKPDCSACNYSTRLPDYRGHYGRGSLEEVANLPEVTSGQSVFHHSPHGHEVREGLCCWGLPVVLGLFCWWVD